MSDYSHCHAAEALRPAAAFPPAVDSHHDQHIRSIFGKLTRRIQQEPFNLVASLIFFGAIIHTFLTAQFRKIPHRYQRRYEAIEHSLPTTTGSPGFAKEHDKLIFRAQFFYFMGEVEAVFGIWLVPLFVAIIAFYGWSTMVDYVGQVNVADAIFVVVIMAIASSLWLLMGFICSKSKLKVIVMVCLQARLVDRPSSHLKIP